MASHIHWNAGELKTSFTGLHRKAQCCRLWSSPDEHLNDSGRSLFVKKLYKSGHHSQYFQSALRLHSGISLPVHIGERQPSSVVIHLFVPKVGVWVLKMQRDPETNNQFEWTKMSLVRANVKTIRWKWRQKRIHEDISVPFFELPRAEKNK